VHIGIILFNCIDKKNIQI